MVYQQFRLYLSNEDSSSVSYREFNLQEKDLYPTFSICLHEYYKIEESEISENFDETALDFLEDFIDIHFSLIKRFLVIYRFM